MSCDLTWISFNTGLGSNSNPRGERTWLVSRDCWCCETIFVVVWGTSSSLQFPLPFSLLRKGNVPLSIYTVEASCELIVFLAATGCEEQGCGECADPIWGSSLPSGLHGLCSGLHLPLLLNWLLKTIPITFFEFELVKSIMQIYVIILLDKGYRMWTILAVRSKFSGWKQYWWLSWSRLWGWMSLTFWICFWVMFFRSIRTVVLISQFHVCQWTTGNHFRSIVATMLMQICCKFFASFIWKLWWTGCKLYWL